jgi:DNA primase small subunit
VTTNSLHVRGEHRGSGDTSEPAKGFALKNVRGIMVGQQMLKESQTGTNEDSASQNGGASGGATTNPVPDPAAQASKPPASTATGAAAAVAAPAASTAALARGDFAAQLKWYYARLFPSELFGRWLSYGDNAYLARREVSLTLPGDIYLRWKSFASAEDLLATLKTQTPIKLDIGAVYNFPPRDKGAVPTPLVPLEKELVFDVDMTDYDDVIGNLAGGSEVEKCDRNWRYMATAVHVLDAALRQDFGFKLILWVYSGRRGIHCWVCDHRARRLNNEQRVAIAEYLNVRFETRENAGRRQTEVTAPLHPSLARAKRVACDATFREFVLGEQGMLDTPARIEAMLASLPNEALRAALRDRLLPGGGGGGSTSNSSTALSKWERIERESIKASAKDYALRGIADYILLKHSYPRLDINVSKEINHLLKAPFCVHPKTGRVCVPFAAQAADDFLPGQDAPQMTALLAEMERPGAATAKMDAAVRIMEEFVQSVEVDVRQRNKELQLARVDRRNALEMMAD